MKAPAMLEGSGCRVVGEEKRSSDCKGERCMEGGLKIASHFFHCSLPFLHVKTEEYESN